MKTYLHVMRPQKFMKAIFTVFLFFMFVMTLSAARTSACQADDSTKVAQNEQFAEVFGRVVSVSQFEKDTPPLPGVFVTLEIQGDTLKAVSDADGIFSFKGLTPGRATLSLACMGKESFIRRYRLKAGNNIFSIGMYDSREQLSASRIVDGIPLVQQVKDTTIYNAAAVRTIAGDNLRELLSQIPGFKVTETGIYINNQKVSKTYVNGKAIFGSNVVSALDFLSAGDVSQLKVYDMQSGEDQRRKLKHSRKLRILDIETKSMLSFVAEAGVLAAGGIDGTAKGRYSGMAAGGYYDEKYQVSANLYGSNASSGFVKSGKGTVEYSTQSTAVGHIIKKAEDFKPLESYTENLGGGIRLNRQWKDKNYGNTLSAYYDYSHVYRKTAESILQEFFGQEDHPATTVKDSSSLFSIDGRHNFGVGLEFNDTPIKSIRADIDGYYTDNRQEMSDFQTSPVPSQQAMHSRNEKRKNDVKDYGLSAELSWTNNDAEKVHPEVGAEFDFSNTDQLSWTTDTASTSYIRRNLTSTGFGRKISSGIHLRLDGTVANNSKRTVSIYGNLASGYRRQKSKQMTFDIIDPEFPVEDLANTYDYTQNKLTNSLSVGCTSNSGKSDLNINVMLRHDMLMDDESYPDPTAFTKHYISVAPSVVYNLVHKKSRFSIQASGNTFTPSIEQLRSRITDTNPMFLQGGNPNLRTAYRADLKFGWSARSANGLISGDSNLSGYSSFNNIVRKTIYFSTDTVLDEWDGYLAREGSRLYTYMNSTQPSWGVQGSVGGSFMLLRRKLILRMNLFAGFDSVPEYLGEKLASSGNLNTGLRMEMNITPVRSLRIGINYSPYYRHITDNRKNLLSENISHSFSITPQLRIGRNGSLILKYYLSHIDYLRGYGKDFTSQRLNASFQWSFLKRSLNLSLHAVDILNSGSKYSSSITALSSTQTWKTVYGRYFMISLNYVFQYKR